MTPARKKQTDGKDKKKPDKARGHTFTALKNSLQDMGKDISKGTDKIADAFVDDSEAGRKAKGQRLKKETMTMVKSIASDVSSDMEGTSFSEVVSDISYGTGRLSRRLRDMEYAVILNRTCHEAGKLTRKAKDALWSKF